MERSEFYSSTGVELTDYQAGRTSMTVTVRKTAFSKYRIQLIGEGGKVLQESHDSPATYAFTGKEKYIRAKVIESNGAVAWCQPVWPG